MADKPNYREEIAAEIIARIEAGTAPWQKPWQAGALGQGPFNPVSGNPYRGINDMWLTLQGHADPRWMTYRQALEAGAQVRKGAKATTIEYWQWTERQAITDVDGKPVLDGEGRPRHQTVRLDRPRVFYAKVFNAEQIEGLEPYIPPPAPEEPLRVVRAEAMLASAGVPILHDQRDRAYYSPVKDEIHLPARASFTSASAYYETALHELGHATGHASRLNRTFGPFGSEVYAREELRAEIASYMLARDMGISFDPSNHAAYVESWLKVLREDKNEIFRAARDAEVIKTWVMEPERRPEIERATKEKGPVIDVTQFLSADDRQRLKEIAPFVEDYTWAHEENDRLYTAAHHFANGKPDLGKSVLKEYWMSFGEDRLAFSVTELNRLEDLRQASELRSLTAEELAEQARILSKGEALRAEEGRPLDVTQFLSAEDRQRLKEIAPFVEDYTWAHEENDRLYTAAHHFANGKPDLGKSVLKEYWMSFGEDRLAFSVTELNRLEDLRQASELRSLTAEELAEQARLLSKGEALRTGDEAKQVAPDERAAAPKSRIYIAVSFSEKDEAKALGAKWDKGAKSWFIPEGVDPTPFSKWDSKAPTPALSPQEEFAEALKANGLLVQGTPEMDGKWHRVAVEGDKAHEKNGSYRAFLDGRPAGQITNFKAGSTVQWVATGVALTDEVRAQIQAEAANVRVQREAAQLAAAEKAAKAAYGVWQNLPREASPDNCAYLAAKGVGAHGVKVDAGGHLVVPCRDENGRLWNIQTVGENGKRFIKESRKAGTMHVVEPSGKGTLDTLSRFGGPIIIGEGYATAARVFEASNRPVVVAFDSGNLMAVAEAVRAKFPDRPILIAADNDHANPLGNVGMVKAEEAAKAVEGAFIAPRFTPEEMAKGLTDFDDLGKARGNDAVRQVIETAVAQLRRQERSLPAPSDRNHAMAM